MDKGKEKSFRARLPKQDHLALEELKRRGCVKDASKMIRAHIRQLAGEKLPIEVLATIYPQLAYEKLRKQNPNSSETDLNRIVEALQLKYKSEHSDSPLIIPARSDDRFSPIEKH